MGENDLRIAVVMFPIMDFFPSVCAHLYIAVEITDATSIF